MDIREIIVANEAFPVPADLDPEGLRILTDAGFVWDSGSLAFQRKPVCFRLRGSAAIEYRFLREQRLVIDSNLSQAERIGQLQRLRILVQSID